MLTLKAVSRARGQAMAAVPAWRSVVLAALCLSVPSICCAQGLDPYSGQHWVLTRTTES